MSKDPQARAEEAAEVLAGLNSAKGLFKREISRNIKVRRIPELIFKIDEALEYGRHISEVIAGLGIENYQSDDEEDTEDEE